MIYDILDTVIMGIIIQEGSYVEGNLSTSYTWSELNLLSLTTSPDFLRIYMRFWKPDLDTLVHLEKKAKEV